MIRGLQPPRGDWVQRGTDIHDYISRLLKRRDLSRLGFFGKYRIQTNVHLFSHSLGLHGICDCIITTENNELFAIEIKTGTNSNSLSLGIKAQIAAYTMLAEEQFKKTARQAFILYENRRSITITIDEKLRNPIKGDDTVTISQASL